MAGFIAHYALRLRWKLGLGYPGERERDSGMNPNSVPGAGSVSATRLLATYVGDPCAEALSRGP